MECHKKHLSIAEEVGDREGKGSAYLHIGLVHDSLGDVPRAMEYYNQGLRNAEEIGDLVKGLVNILLSTPLRAFQG